MTKVLYYLVIKPLSLLPLQILYGISNVLAFLLKYVIPYRKEVIMENLRNSFPNKSEEELITIKNEFLDYFADFMMESLRLFSMPKKEVDQRLVVRNPEVVDQFHAQGRHIVVATGHYGNWEMAAAGVSQGTKYTFNGIFSPLKNKFLNQKIVESRTLYGTVITNKNSFKYWMKQIHELKELQALTFICDQSATYSKNVYWMNFLNQETAVMFGAEKYAKNMAAPFILGRIHVMKRGHYEISFHLVTEDASKEPHGFITEAHTKALEEWIKEAPQYWLWTHRRWKRKRKAGEVLAD